jgi:DNA recombination protein RmuC
MSYQMINALDMDIMPQVVQCSMDYIEQLKTNDDVFLDYLKDNTNFSNDYEVLVALVEQNRDFLRSEYFRDRKRKIIEAYVLNFKNGKIIQNAETNQTMRPDVIVRYPDQRAIIIDSKVSLTAYLDFINATTTEEKDDAIKRHLKSIKNHIDELATRNYAQYLSSSPDFVMMFIPNEPAYYLVQEKNPSIWEYAYKKKVVMITPTNLITALRMFSEIWQRDEQFKNVEQIIDRANKMYDKIVNYLETFEKLGKSIKSAAKDYDVAMGQLKEGPGNVVRQIQELEKLGVKSLHSKIIPSSLRSQGDELLE